VSKTIVFCADGTWNGPGEPDSDDKTSPATNVFKLFVNLDGTDTPDSYLLEKEQERVATQGGVALQCAKYIHGVGDSDNYLVKLLGGTLGAGLVVRIVRGYTYISRNYLPGDKIFIAGFSRGAYTARALAGMIAAQGLLDASKLDLTDKNTAYRLGSAVWYQWRKTALQATSLLGKLEETVLDIPGILTSAPRGDLMLSAPIEAVAVWDTVGALGIPEFTRSMIRVDVFRFADTELSRSVQNGLQAIAVDEQREDFTPTFWDDDARITQALFPGAHADVGGGYPLGSESGLPDRTLEWISRELARLGVQFLASPAFPATPNAAGTAHRPWEHGIFAALAKGPRTFPAGFRLAQYVLDRMTAGNVIPDPGATACPYVPPNLTGYITGGKPRPGVLIV
jgi:uncharacterized protein (DUF2235 family)